MTTTSSDFDIFHMLDKIQEIYQGFALGSDDAGAVLSLINAIISVIEEGDIPEMEPVTETRPKAGTATNARGRVLQTAEAHVNGERNDDYGDPISDFRTTANFWSEYLNRIVERRSTSSVELLPHDVAAMMMLLKVSRLSWSPEVDDHWIDAAGYAACGFDCVEREA